MKANELRIGNYVRLFKDTPSKVIGFANGLLYIHYNEKKYFTIELQDASPIPLTEEWLLKFGFEKKENGLFTKKLEYIYNSLKYCDDYKIWIYYNDDNDAACNAIADLNYVHELQNLYFALTKEELTMK